MLIDVFNETWNNISTSYMKFGDDSTSVIRFWTTEKGNLPHFSYISAIQNQQVQSSRMWIVLLMGPCSSCRYKEGGKG